MSFPLNGDQRRAATTLDKPVLVTAGAGSGKTRMLTERLINAVLPGAVPGWEPVGIDQIAAITFTDKAAGELAERVRRALRDAGQRDAARKVDSAWVSTIHGMCSRLLRRHALDASVDPLFGIAEGVHAGALREQAFETAALEVLRDDAAGAALFDAYSYADLFSMAVGVSRELAARGMPIEALAFETARPLDELVAETVDLLSAGCTMCEERPALPQKGVEFGDRCAALLAELLELDAIHPQEGERLAALARLVNQKLTPYKNIFKEDAEEFKARHAVLQESVGTALVAPLGSPLKNLIARYANEYSRHKGAAAVLDFDDLQVKAVELLERDPRLAEKYRRQFRLVMIDEFQDTDALQLRLVEALSDGDLCSVGDEKQSIYRFRGADVDVYRDHQRRMQEQGAEEVELPVNYRSHPEVLSFVNAVFSADSYFGNELLRLASPEGRGPGRTIDEQLGDRPRVESLFIDRSGFETDATELGRRAEAAALANRLAELNAAGVTCGDMAILVRAYRHAHLYADALAAHSIPAVIIGGSRFFDLEEVAIMHALVRVIANPSDGVALGQLLVSEFCPISDDGLAVMRISEEGRSRQPLWQMLRTDAHVLSADDAAAAERLVETVLRGQKDLGQRPLGDIVLEAAESVGYDLRLLGKGNMGRDAFANVLKFAREASAFESNGRGGAAAFAVDLEARKTLGEPEQPASLADTGEGAVRIMSVHASKGLEFSVVAVVDLASSGGGRPTAVRTAIEGDRLLVAPKPPATDDGAGRLESAWSARFKEAERSAEEEEGNRVLYVALTRAKDLLITSGSMRLRTKTPPTGNDHLVRLGRIIGLPMPITGLQDLEASARDAYTGEIARVRVRVVDGRDFVDAEGESTDTEIDEASETSPMMVPEVGERFAVRLGGGLAPRRTSYSSLALFKQCPRRYFVQSVLGLRRIEVVTPGETTATQFGSALHAVLQLVDGAGMLPSDDRIRAIARHTELDAEQRARLVTAATRFVDSPIASRVKRSPRVAREMPFTIPVAGGATLLRGNIDLYARDGDTALIVDYKSGTSGEIEELAERYALQARCYGLAALVDGASLVQVVFVRPEVDSEDGALQQVAFEFTTADEVSIRGELDSLVSAIGSSDFPCNTGWTSETCEGCPAPTALCSFVRY